MSLIQIQNLTFSYPASSNAIFENVSVQLDTDWKLGLVGRNGRGKTTLLKLLMGEYGYSGQIISSVPFAYFPYPVKEEGKLTEEVLGQVCPTGEEWELLREFSYLEVEEDVLWRSFETLSQGEQTKVLLAALFLNEGRFLLIDEPTNHLDTRGRELVSAYLNRKKGFILVSHDRRFIDGCVDHILSLNRTDMEVQRGNFSSWFQNFQQRQQLELSQNQRLKKDIHRLKEASRRTAGWSNQVEQTKHGGRNAGLKLDKGYVGHKAAKMMKRAKGLEARQQQAIEQKTGLLKNIETAGPLKLSPLTYREELLASYSGVSVCYGGRRVCDPISFTLRRGERVALDGKNGSGKSSLLKLLTGEPIEHTGKMYTGSGIVISYVPQDTSRLKGTLSEFAEKSHIDESLFKAILRKMGFERAQFETDMEGFSGGQKKKALLARSLCEQAHLYVWDEPLNFIDIYSRMQIEQLIATYQPTMVFVEHDRAFREAAATMTVSL